MTDPRAVCVLQPAFLGDVVFTSPLVRALRARFPEARVDFVATPRGAVLARALPGVAQVFTFDKRGKDSGLAGLRRVGARLRAQKYDLFVSCHTSPRSAALALLSRAPARVGFATGLGRAAWTVRAPWRPEAPFVERMLDLARAVGAPGSDPRLLLAVPEEGRALALRRLGQSGPPVLGLCIGSEWATKRWPAAKFAALCDLAQSEGLRPVLLGGPAERDLAAEVLAAARRPADIVDTVGDSIEGALGVLERAAAVVGGDTGLVHAARALGRPTVALFGPTDPAAHVWEATSRVLTAGVVCQPCSVHGQRACPLGHHDCMKNLEPRAVLAALRAVLGLQRP